MRANFDQALEWVGITADLLKYDTSVCPDRDFAVGMALLHTSFTSRAARHEEMETWRFFHRNADRTAHLNEQHYRYGGVVCPLCREEIQHG